MKRLTTRKLGIAMTDPILINLLFTILALTLGILIGHLFNRAVRHDMSETLAEASRVMLNLQDENERLEAELEQMRTGLDRLAGMRLAGETDEEEHDGKTS